MHSEWRITSQYIDGEKEFQVYRLRDVTKVDHSGNLEYTGGIVRSREEALALLEEINRNGTWNFYRKEMTEMTKREKAEIILRAIEEKGPVQINWNNEERWMHAIMIGLTDIEKAETPAAGTAGESR